MAFEVLVEVRRIRCMALQIDEGDGWKDTNQPKIENIGESSVVSERVEWQSGGASPRHPQQAYMLARRNLDHVEQQQALLGQYEADCRAGR